MTIRHHLSVSALLIVTALWGAACTSGSLRSKKAYTPEEILQDVRSRVSPETIERFSVPFEIDDEIRAFAHQAVERTTSDRQKAYYLVQAIIDKTSLSISYDWLSNKTAREVFLEGRGNCLAYTNLFIGMAREVGLDAVYVDVVTMEKVSKEGEVIINNGHITGGVWVGPDLMLIDFTRTPEREYGGYVVIDDLEAIANYYNNQGFLYGYFAETIDDGDTRVDPLELEMAMYEMSLAIDPNLTRARNNLGVALKRRGRIDEAIEQYKLAIERDPDFAEAHSNLGSAYYSIGRVEDAMREFEIAAKKGGGSNAYFHHHLGVLRFQQGDYEDAVKRFKKALSAKGDLADSRYFLGECYLKLGKTEEAVKEFERTLEIDPNYLSARAKLDMLSTSVQLNPY